MMESRRQTSACVQGWLAGWAHISMVYSSYRFPAAVSLFALRSWTRPRPPWATAAQGSVRLINMTWRGEKKKKLFSRRLLLTSRNNARSVQTRGGGRESRRPLIRRRSLEERDSDPESSVSADCQCWGRNELHVTPSSNSINSSED